jgi:hypothetical protein
MIHILLQLTVSTFGSVTLHTVTLKGTVHVLPRIQIYFQGHSYLSGILDKEAFFVLGKVKIKLFLCVTNHHTMTTY